MDGPQNMALDAVLMARARRTGESVLRVYSWSQPVLSFGRNQAARGVYDEAKLRDLGFGIVRRPTGGRALLHDHEITYSVTAPVEPELALGDSYRRMNALLVHSLAKLGVDTELARPAAPALRPSSVPCFAEPAAGEITFDGRKLIGSAQWRDDGALLQHGSIIVDDDQALIPSFMRAPADPPMPPATLRAILGRAPEPTELAQVLFGSIVELLDPIATWLPNEEIAALEVDIEAAHFRDERWTWRR